MIPLVTQLRLVDAPERPTIYTTVLADPAWRYGDKLRMKNRKGELIKRSSVDHYDLTMSVDEICALGRGPHVAVPYDRPPGIRPLQYEYTIAGLQTSEVGFLCLWAPPAFVLDGSATKVARAWGYEPKQLVPWIKGRIKLQMPIDDAHGNVYDPALVLQMGMGRIFRNVVEYLVICTRGEGYTKLVKHHGTNGLIIAEEDAVIIAERPTSPSRGVEHSTKPKEQYCLIETVLPSPYLELYACEKREGWTSVGSVFGQLLTPNGVVPYEGPDGVLPDPGLEWDF